MVTTGAFTARSDHSVQFHVLVVDRQVVDAAIRRRDPARHFSRFDYAFHQAVHEVTVGFAGNPFGHAPLVFLAADRPALRVGRHVGPGSDGTAAARTPQAGVHLVTVALGLP